MRGMMGGFYRLSEWIMRLAAVNLLWLICSFPFWLAGFAGFAALQTAGAAEQRQIMAWTAALMAVLSPFTFFPATSAMFSVARKWVTGDADAPLLATFFRNYKQNYRQAMIGGVAYTAMLAVLVFDYLAYPAVMGGMRGFDLVFVVLSIALLISLHHFFALLSHFHMTTGQLLKNAFILTFARPLRSLAMGLASFAVMAVSLQPRLLFLHLFFSGSLTAAMTFYQFRLLLAKLPGMAVSGAARERRKAQEDREIGG